MTFNAASLAPEGEDGMWYTWANTPEPGSNDGGGGCGGGGGGCGGGGCGGGGGGGGGCGGGGDVPMALAANKSNGCNTRMRFKTGHMSRFTTGIRW